MKYVLLGGVLHDVECRARFAQIRPAVPGPGLTGPARSIEIMPKGESWETGIRLGAGNPGDARNREYVARARAGAEKLLGRPVYAQDPERAGWPVNRAPRVDSAEITAGGERYVLRMESPSLYTLSAPGTPRILTVRHRGLRGGWDIEAEDRLTPGLICAVFIFSRYIEGENELVTM